MLVRHAVTCVTMALATCRRLLDILGGARGHVAEDQLLGHASAEIYDQLLQSSFPWCWNISSFSGSGMV